MRLLAGDSLGALRCYLFFSCCRMTAKVEQWLKDRQQAAAAQQQQQQQQAAAPGATRQTGGDCAMPAMPAGRGQPGGPADRSAAAALRQREYEWSDSDSEFDAVPHAAPRTAAQSGAAGAAKASSSRSSAAGPGKLGPAEALAVRTENGAAATAALAAVEICRHAHPKAGPAVPARQGLVPQPSTAVAAAAAGAAVAAPGPQRGQGQPIIEGPPAASRRPSKLSLAPRSGIGSRAHAQHPPEAAGAAAVAVAPADNMHAPAALQQGLPSRVPGKRKAPAAQERGSAGRGPASGSAAPKADSDSDSEFVAGTLRQAPAQLAPVATSGKNGGPTKWVHLRSACNMLVVLPLLLDLSSLAAHTSLQGVSFCSIHFNC